MKSSFHFRCIVMSLSLVSGLSVLSARLIQVQLVDRKKYAEGARRTYARTETLPAIRGMIVDRREEPLAKSIPVTTVILDKKIFFDEKLAAYGVAHQEASQEQEWAEWDPVARLRRVQELREEILRREPAEVIVQKHLAYAVGILSRPLGMRREELREKIERSKGSWIPLAKEMPEDLAEVVREAVKEHLLQGFEFDHSIKRWYTSPNLATHLIGFTGEVEKTDESGKKRTSVEGRFGIEAAMEEYLAGRDGWRKQKRDQRGLVVAGDSGSLLPPRAGLNVQLTLDMGIQAIVEEELDAGLREYQAERGAVVLMNPKTGEILAMASRPHFDLNRKENLAQNSFNYAIQAIYEPGSTIKIVAVAGALNEGLVAPQTSVYCHNGYYQEGAVVLRDSHPHANLTVEGILQKSNNIGTFKLARQLGNARFYEYVERFGFGRKSGIQLSGESRGVVRNSRNPMDFSRAAFGYAMSITPLQMATAYSAIAGDGKLRKPHIVKALVANDGTVVEEYEPEVVGEALTARTAAQMRTALEKVVLPGGTATQAAVPGFRVAGKTGTAQKMSPNGKGYLKNRYITSFAGMMPAHEPAFVCYVVVDDPRTQTVSHYGGTIAAPIFSKIAARVASRMNLQPTEPVSPALSRLSAP